MTCTWRAAPGVAVEQKTAVILTTEAYTTTEIAITADTATVMENTDARHALHLAGVKSPALFFARKRQKNGKKTFRFGAVFGLVRISVNTRKQRIYRDLFRFLRVGSCYGVFSRKMPTLGLKPRKHRTMISNGKKTAKKLYKKRAAQKMLSISFPARVVISSVT